MMWMRWAARLNAKLMRWAARLNAKLMPSDDRIDVKQIDHPGLRKTEILLDGSV
jgi:hypothetical protein